MPWEIATYLLGAQGGVEDDFARLYDVTNPVLVRYLRVITDAGPDELAELALGAWTAALPQLTACPPDEDAWLELVIGSAAVAAGGSLRGEGGGASTATANPAPDELDRAIEALRACPPDEADVLAMGLIANLGRDATARLTGHEPSAVLALVQRGQEHLPMSLESLTAALRAPARAGEVADLQRVSPLIATALAGPVPIAGGDTEAVQATSVAVALSATHARPGLPVSALTEPSLAELLGMESAAASGVVGLSAFRSAAGTPSRSARVGVGAGVWLLAVGGVGTAAAMTGFVTAAIDGIFGNHNAAPLVTAEGPATPGTPFPGGNTGGGTGGNTGGGTGGNTGGGTGGNPGGGTGGKVPSGPGTRPAPKGHTSTPPGPQQATGGGSAQAVSLPGRSRTIQIVLTSFGVPTDSVPATPTVIPTTPTVPTTPTIPTTPTGVVSGPVPVPPVSVPPASQGNGKGNGDKTVAQAGRQAEREAKATAKAAAKAAAKAEREAKATAKAAAKAAAKAEREANATAKAERKASSKHKGLGHATSTAKGHAETTAHGHKAHGKAHGHTKA
ncbi:hypothetical protein BJ986_002520 [Phycicoccus badiiscoriae]|uniref:Uncharacterized protein n=1 Tax=Pedococcus badiiscoriae TaxID=642776 RepID=A0A852WFM2_9MICO|nr:hypothetical protein [Pedococcus badiiscoriae]NYG08033.1 hypothetical protein [Pedococcus badiiscoriae]